MLKRGLIEKLVWKYTKYPARAVKEYNQMGQKFRLTQKVQDKVNTQRFIENQLKSGKIVKNTERVQQHNREFSEFLKTYRPKRRNIANIVDLSEYNNRLNPFNKTEKERVDEIELLEDFRRRQRERMNYFRRRSAIDDRLDNPDEPHYNDEVEDTSNIQNEVMSDDDGETQEDQNEEEIDENESSFGLKPRHPHKRKLQNHDQDSLDKIIDFDGYYENDISNVKSELDEIGDGQFTLIILHQGSSTHITKLNRIVSSRCLVFMGNDEGVVGWGYGKDVGFAEALDDAIENCINNMIVIPIDEQMTLLHTMHTHYNGYKVKLYSRPKLGLNSWGDPILLNLLLRTGIRDVMFKTMVRNINPYSMIYAFFKIITRSNTVKDYCEKTGRKIYAQNFGKPYYLDPNNPNKGNFYR